MQYPRVLRRFFIRCITLLAMIAVLTSCTTVGRTLNLESSIKLDFYVWEDINPDDRGRPSPLVVRLYELYDYRQFENENFLDLYTDDRGLLGPDLVSKRLLKELAPGENRQERFVIDDRTQYIGLMGEFIQYENAKFRVVIPVKSHVANSAKVWVQQLNMALSDKKREQVSQLEDGKVYNIKHQRAYQGAN